MTTTNQNISAPAEWFRLLRRLAGQATLVGALGVLGFPASAFAVSCGDLITTDVTLTADLLNCPDQGLFVNSASGITIDLNGHRITGAPGSSSGIGIVSSSKLRIVGAGEIYGFRAGVAVNNSAGITIENLHLHHNQSNNIYLLNVTDSDVSDNRLSDSINGVAVEGMGVAKNNRIQYNTAFDHQTAVFLHGADKTYVRGNYLRENGAGVGISSGSDNEVIRNGIHSNRNGIVIDNAALNGRGSHGNRIHENKVYDNIIGAILIGPSGGRWYNKYNELKKNVFHGGQTGIQVDGSRNYGTGIYDNSLWGMSGSYFDDTGRATRYAGNICTPGPC